MRAAVQVHKGKQKRIDIPLLFALLEEKTENSYNKVIGVVLSLAKDFEIFVQYPQTVISNFGLAIINPIKTHFGDAAVLVFLFHLWKIV